MSNKTLAVVLLVAGVVILAVGILAPSLGLSFLTGHTTRITVLLIVGAGVAVAGLVMLFMKGTARK